VPTSADDYLAVADAVEALPEAALALLRLGPLDEPSCRICRTLEPLADENATTILDFHEVGDHELAEAGRDALGRDRRLGNDELEAALGYQRKLERLPERNIQRCTVESLCENIMWYRCLYVYVLAGWRP
jgi:hypothetical protein